MKPSAPAAAATADAPGRPDRFDVVVIGAGQAGLAIGYFLTRQGRRFAILEAADAVGAAWRGRWDSLVLFTPRRYDALPGLAFPGDPDGYPTRDEVIAYLERYAASSIFRSSSRRAVRSLSQENGAFRTRRRRQRRSWPIRSSSRPARSRRPRHALRRRATRARGLPDAQRRLPTTERGARRDACSSSAAATPASRSRRSCGDARAVHLAIGSRQTPLPQRLLGRDVFWWLTKLGLLNEDGRLRIGRRARDRDTLIGSSPRDAQAALWRRAAAARRRRLRPEGHVRRRQRARGRRGDLGDRLPSRTTPGSTCPVLDATTVVSVIAAASATFRASTSSGSGVAAHARLRAARLRQPTTQRSSRARSTGDREPASPETAPTSRPARQRARTEGV